MWLLLLAALGNLVPGGLFLYWLFNAYTSLSAALSDRLALAFFVDLLISTFLLAYLFARKPIGPIRWPRRIFGIRSIGRRSHDSRRIPPHGPEPA